jgi:hypothetical protein
VASFSRSLSSPALKKASPCISILRKSPERSGETRSRGVSTDRVCDGSRMGHTAQAAHDKASAGCRQQSNIQASIEFRELTLVHAPAVRVDHFNTPRNGNNLPGLFRVYPNPAVESDRRFQREASAEKGEEKMRGVEKSARPEAQTKSESRMWGKTHCLDILRLHRTMKPPLSSPNPSALRVWASKHSSSGSISLCARDTRA